VTERVRFATAGGHELVGLYRAAGAPAAVLCHGMLSSKESEKIADLAGLLAARGVSSLRFDMSGRGESGGDPRRILYSQEVADLQAAVALVRARGHGRVGLFGSSMGGAVVVLQAARDPAVVAVVTLAGVSRPARWLGEMAPAEVDRWRAQGFFVYDGAPISVEHLEDSLATDVLGAARALRCPLLVLHGARDAVVPLEDGELLARAAPRSELVVFPEADHRFSRAEDRAAAVGRAAEFLAGHLSPRPG
jgi:hypothetical protein